jgi:hypothetical protein
MWGEQANALSDAVDEAFGEAFVFRPMARATPNERLAPDASRAVRTIVAVFSAPHLGIAEIGRERRADGRWGRSAGGSSSEPSISVDARAFVAGEEPRRGDRFERTATGDVCEAKDVQPDGQGRMVITLGHVT